MRFCDYEIMSDLCLCVLPESSAFNAAASKILALHSYFTIQLVTLTKEKLNFIPSQLVLDLLTNLIWWL